MTARRAVTAVVAAAAALGALASAGAPDDLERRLSQLDPARPFAYFELAEEVADGAETDAQRDLARRLFGLAGALDPPRLGRSACLALADLAADEHTRRRLRALAWLLDRRGAALTERSRYAESYGPEAALAVAEAFSYYRRGLGGRALRALEVSGAMELLQAHDHVFRGGAKRFLADCELYRGGRQAPSIAPADLSRMLNVEAALLAGAERSSWSAELLLTRGEPLIEVDPDRLSEELGVDPKAARWRTGRWE